MGKGKKSGKKQKSEREIKEEALRAGMAMAAASPLFGKMGGELWMVSPSSGRMGSGVWTTSLQSNMRGMSKEDVSIVTGDGGIFLNQDCLLAPAQWAYVIAHCKLHLAFGHFDKEKMPQTGYGDITENVWREQGKRAKTPSADAQGIDLCLWNMACDIYVAKFLADIKFGQPICPNPADVYGENLTDERKIYERLMEGRGRQSQEQSEAGVRSQARRNWNGMGDGSLSGYGAVAGIDVNGYGTALGMDMRGLEHPIVYDKQKKQYNRYATQFAYALADAVTTTVGKAGGVEKSETMTASKKAAGWFVSHYPLLGGLAASFRIIEDYSYCMKEEIQVAAVDPMLGEIYVNPAAGLREEELKFVLAHEFLHAGLGHHLRQEGRDAQLWNVACDYVINGWLSEMGIGEMPEGGLLYDEGLKNKSAEEIYDLILSNIRKYQKLDTFRGYGKGDVMCGQRKSYGDLGRGGLANRGTWDAVSMDEFCKNALMQGLEYHQSSGRGFVPAGLIQEIRALAMPPVPWDVELARWFDEMFPYIEKKRTYARPSRRQGATPDIPRPRYVKDEALSEARTFGVVIDTSGSMSAERIGMALGSVASYAAVREVPLARVIFCDAAAYDAGYLSPEEIAGRVKVKGRGGTRLQPGVDALERAKDFPKDGPILLITDGEIEERMTIHRQHAFLIPKGKRLPFRARGKVFYFS